MCKHATWFTISVHTDWQIRGKDLLVVDDRIAGIRDEREREKLPLTFACVSVFSFSLFSLLVLLLLRLRLVFCENGLLLCSFSLLFGDWSAGRELL
jgi:hypothetical protein